LSYTGPRIILYTFLSNMLNCFLSLFVSIKVSDAYVNILSIIVFFSISFSFLGMYEVYSMCYSSTEIVMVNGIVNEAQHQE
jgi:hypothetical protein